ncbi:MAG TPA: V-type ATP synthase subunit D [Methanocorpusculum sp.]|nr:V-type ATP synthase subunit D [Methanocorpusculum sp.]
MALNVKPTRSELINLKKRIELSQRGYKLLKMKRDGLILEFFKVLAEAKNLKNELAEKYARAHKMIAIAETVEGTLRIKAVAMAASENPEINLKSKNIMGVVVPKIESKSVKKSLNKRGYSVLGTSAAIDEAADAFEDLVECIILSAELDTTMKRLLDEIEGTKRRVNALEFKVIPELVAARDFIKMRLDEMEREELTRLKRTKGKSAAKEAAA